MNNALGLVSRCGAVVLLLATAAAGGFIVGRTTAPPPAPPCQDTAALVLGARVVTYPLC